MLYSLDLETTGLSRFTDRILCIGVYNRETGYTGFLSAGDFLSWHKADNQYICHNGSFDVSFLRSNGVDIRTSFAYDTRSIATVLTPTPEIGDRQKHTYALENLAMVLLGLDAYKLDRTTLSDVPTGVLLEYNRRDCEVTFDLFNYLKANLEPKAWAFVENWVMPATRLVSDMSYNGVSVDQPKLLEYKKAIEATLVNVNIELEQSTALARKAWYEIKLKETKELYNQMLIRAVIKAKDKEKARLRYEGLFEKAKEKIEPFNFSSPLQLKWLLKDYYGLDIFNKRSEKETTDEAMLKEHAAKGHTVCEVLTRFRELEKLVSTCIPAVLDNVAPDGRVHPSFNIGGTRTGRLSSSGPNFQQVPKGPIRTCIVAETGHSLLVADYAQIEVRIIAELAKEVKLINAFKEGIDPYSLIAKSLLGLEGDVREIKKKYPKHRDVAKTAGLSILYGTGAGKLREVLGKELGLKIKLEEAKQFIESYRANFSYISFYKEQLEQQMANRKVVYSLLGRPSYIHNNEDLYMTALNTIVQGSASDLVVNAFSRIYSKYSFIKPVLVVHDEMVMEIPNDKLTDEFVKEIEIEATANMQKLLGLSVPLKIEYHVGREWVKP